MKAIKTSEYLNRVGGCGNSWHAFVTCWHVVTDDCPVVEKFDDIPSKCLVSGGFYRGNNCFSGKAKYPTRKEALASQQA